MSFVLPTRPIKSPPPTTPPTVPPPLIDPDATQVPFITTTACTSIWFGCLSDTPRAQLTVNVFFSDSLGNFAGGIRDVVLVAGQVPEWGKSYACSFSDGSEPTLHAAGDKAFIQCLSMSPVTATFQLGGGAR